MDRELGVFGKARAIACLALVGATIGLVVAPLAHLLWQTLWWMGEGLPLDPHFWRYVAIGIPYAAKEWALLGAFTGGSFGALLLATRERRRLEDLPILRVGALGGLAGATFLVVYTAAFGDLSWLAYPEAYKPLAFTGLLGAGLTTGMVTLAKHAPPEALPPERPRDRIIGGPMVSR